MTANANEMIEEAANKRRLDALSINDFDGSLEQENCANMDAFVEQAKSLLNRSQASLDALGDNMCEAFRESAKNFHEDLESAVSWIEAQAEYYSARARGEE